MEMDDHSSLSPGVYVGVMQGKPRTELAESRAVFCVEDLKGTNIAASAAGTAAAPGGRVRPRATLNRSILDQALSMFAEPLEYKLGWRGKQPIKVPAAYTSPRCSACGHVHA